MIGTLALYLIAAPPGEWALPPLSFILMALMAGWWLAGFGLMLYAAISGAAKWARPILQRLLGTTGRLMADNLRRDRQRVALTVLTLIASLTMIVSVNGTLQHIGVSITQADENLLRTWVFLSFDINGGMETYRKLTITSLQIPPERLTKIEAIAGESALVSGAYAVIVPQLSFLIPNLPSFIVDEHALRRAGIVNFYEGGWETAMPPMESGCGLLLTPLVAQNNDVWTGDTITINSGVEGPIECTVAGIGTSPVFNTSVLSSRMARAYGVIAPAAIIIQPNIDADADALIAALSAFADEHENLYLINVADFFTQIREGAGEFTALLNGPLLLTILVAMAGVTNTMMMSVTERQHELGLLRAVGATRRQIRVIVAGEAALMGLIGAALGVIVGAGLVAIVAVSGSSAFWNVRTNLWRTAIEALRPALGAGLLGLIAAPVLCALAAWIPARAIVRGTPIQTLESEH
jgi:putative ABC transport system permease protein